MIGGNASAMPARASVPSFGTPKLDKPCAVLVLDVLPSPPTACRSRAASSSTCFEDFALRCAKKAGVTIDNQQRSKKTGYIS